MTTTTTTETQHFGWCNVTGGMGNGCWPDGPGDGHGGITEVTGMGHQSTPTTYDAHGFSFDVQVAAYQSIQGDPGDSVEPYMFVADLAHPSGAHTSPRDVAAFAAALHAAAVTIGRQIGQPVSGAYVDAEWLEEPWDGRGWGAPHCADITPGALPARWRTTNIDRIVAEPHIDDDGTAFVLLLTACESEEHDTPLTLDEAEAYGHAILEAVRAAREAAVTAR
ncbi:hypothetical protein [Georgenia sp. H159]|uniref:hypothetical protein n=1 Tax=Georgenia sp. H159 TaxID=3076115 RepID=UPI002D781FBD|nr:hypothetical protein [Georgenia sp. H159]